jgi:hypothetical protein
MCYGVTIIGNDKIALFFALMNNASTLSRKFITFYQYCSEFIEANIASSSYRSWLIGITIDSFSYHSGNILTVIGPHSCGSGHIGIVIDSLGYCSGNILAAIASCS